MTGIPTKIGMALIIVYWLAMGGMVINAYYSQDVFIDGVSLSD